MIDFRKLPEALRKHDRVLDRRRQHLDRIGRRVRIAHEIEQRGLPQDAANIGAESGRELLALAGPNFLASLTAR